MEILTVEAGMPGGKNVGGKNSSTATYDHRLRRRSSVRLLVRVVAGTYHRSRLNMAEPGKRRASFRK